ncbi:MAG: tRNA (adenosine(37)-N6)-threonylcarbamoyltransferase complex ATPase subunit type 1 TsaE [Betaproteobacteria bacterium]|nr:tRNA (adenosine(37)-N6)-threonylcarbamoyltransferase complex ATPase subunit type 1 TsaE [Betaproteobacteria bacterium]
MLHTEADTLRLGANLAPALGRGTKIYLRGDLGAGKTTLVRGLLRALGHEGPVKSPTYTLVELYELSRLHLHHFDFYRLSHWEEWDDAGFREIFGSDSICLVEWPENAGPSLPPPDLLMHLEHAPSGRLVTMNTPTAAGLSLLQQPSIAATLKR